MLWLLNGTGDTNGRLVQLALQSGIMPDELIFASKKPDPQHLARYALADLFLDTFPYGAHTTASDAMWMGVPVLTVRGQGFASRVCASLVTAAGIGDLVCEDHNAYVGRAIEFGAESKGSGTAEEETEGWPRVEFAFQYACFLQIWRSNTGRCGTSTGGVRFRSRAWSIWMHTMTSLCRADTGNVPMAPNASLQQRYRKELEIWNECWPIQPDSRLWRG